MLQKEYTRYMLWTPVLLSIGIHIYFSLPFEPSLHILKILVILFVSFLVASYCFPRMCIFLYAIAFVLSGFIISQTKTILINTPRLLKSLPLTQLQGIIQEVETTTYGYRLTILTTAIEGLYPTKTPKKVSLVLRRKELPSLQIGDTLSAKVKLMPVQGPVFPGGFDFRKKSFFQQIGAQGFILRDLKITPPSSGRQAHQINLLRQYINKILYTTLPGHTGAVATALITGEKTLIDRQLKEDFADAGIAHVLAISGLHLSLVAGLFFLLSRGLLAPITFMSQRFNTKKIAAILAFFGALGYLGISGATIPTQRAFIMFSMLMLAILTDRIALSLRTLALAALIVLTISPESLSTPSFQLSFAAVLGLMSSYEIPFIQQFFQGIQGWKKILFYLLGVLCSTIIASVATLPFTIYHFHRFTLQSIAANLVVIPLMGFWIMPLALSAMITLWIPQIAEFFLHGMGYGIDYMIHTATTVAHWPGAAIYVPQTSPGFLYCIVGGGLWLCLWQQSWRWFGLIPLVSSLYFIFMAKTSDIFISEDTKYIGVQHQNHLFVNSIRTKTFLSENWAHATGLPTTSLRRWKNTKSLNPPAPVNCIEEACIFQTQHFKIGYLKTTKRLEDWCSKADVLLIREPLREKRKLCQGPKLIIDRFDSWRNGAYMVTYDPQAKIFRYTTAKDLVGNRPWSYKT